MAEEVRPHSVIIRTLDLGGDKFMSALNLPEELNPFLGWRAIRFCLERVDIFKTQLRAILRASAVGNVKMMYPMISGVDELRRANVDPRGMPRGTAQRRQALRREAWKSAR